jgi:DNA repair protein RadD
VRIVEEIKALARSGKRRILVYAPTGAGKTEMFAALAEVASGNDKLCWVVVHREELAHQAAERIRSRGMACGIWMGTGRSTVPGATVQVVGVQTIASKIRRAVGEGRTDPAPAPGDVRQATQELEGPAGGSRDEGPLCWMEPAGRPSAVFIDEAHHCVSPSWRSVLDHLTASGALATLWSATPWQKNGSGLGVADALVVGPSPSELRDLGVLVDPVIYCGPTPDLSGVGITAGDFSQAALAERTDVVVADVVKTWMKLSQGRRTLAFAVNVAHSQHLVSEWRAVGVAAEHVDGTTPDDVRRSIFNRLASGEVTVVSNVGIVTEGFDCPSVETAVLARPTQSELLYIQMVGRALRASEGKTSCLILDHGYNALRHGHPMMDRPISLLGRPPRKRVSEADLMDADLHFRLCASCMKACPLDVLNCPGCGQPLKRVKKVVERRQVELVRYTELPAEDRSKVKIMERRRAWFAMEARRNGDPWQTSYQYSRRYGIMPHDDRIFFTQWERQAYWQLRKGKPRGG